MEDRKKLQKFAIRKLSMGVGSVLIGLAFIGGTLEPKLVQADETKQVSFHYLAESELTAAERELIHHELPQDLSQESYYLVYRKQGQAVLPQTGSISFPLAGVGLLTASLVVFLFSKKKPSKIVGVLLIASLGKSLLLPYHLFAFEYKDLLAYDQTKTLVSADGLSQGIIDIKGYDYVGYLLESDLRGIGQDLTSIASPEIPAKPVNQAAVHEIPEFTGGVSGESLVEPTKPTFEGGVNGPGAVAESLPEYTPELSSQSGVPEVHDKADFTGGVSGESLVEPTKPTFEGGVNGPGTVAEALPEYTPELSSQSGIPEVHDKPDFTGGVSGESLVEPTKPTFEGGVNGPGTVVEVLPDYEGGAVPVDTLKQEISSYSGGVNATEALIQDTNPTLHIEVRKELVPKQTREKIDPEMLVGETRIEQVGQDGEKEIVTSYEEKDGKRISEPKETTRILTEAKDQVIIRGSKEKEEIKPEPVLTLSTITGNSMGRSARLSYNLEKADGVTISKISATIKAKGLEDQTLDLTSDQLEATVDNLKLYTDYTISTKMVFNRGKGEESTLLEDKKLRLELKKLEIKDIKETSLVKVENGKESEIQHLTEVPRNLEDYYLKIN